NTLRTSNPLNVYYTIPRDTSGGQHALNPCQRRFTHPSEAHAEAMTAEAMPPHSRLKSDSYCFTWEEVKPSTRNTHTPTSLLTPLEPASKYCYRQSPQMRHKHERKSHLQFAP
ncbi:hypothetical protein DQ04_21951000, partial [Trypanosoma grayi]|uniref:hypothetical protein n=1 Tax=Trypanosoma grayi TaxID=71804 RepID=UPI0004F4173E